MLYYSKIKSSLVKIYFVLLLLYNYDKILKNEVIFMLYKFLRSKKGFTLVELMVVAAILSVLTAVSIPLVGSLLKQQRRNDCINQREVISATIKQAMYGMLDNGKRQPVIDFEKLQDDHYCAYPGDGVDGNADDAYVNKRCFILWSGKVDSVKDSQDITHTINQVAFTLGDLRGGYRTSSDMSYNEGCEAGYYLKKNALKDDPFYEYLDNDEIPVCPFADEYTDKPEYFYYIFEDGTVLCSCPECNETD